jgi:serine/threonine-protein kinase
VDEALRITREVAEVLALAHEQGLVHRDIKPANILLATERTMVADFGLARAVEEAGTDRLTESGLAVGTPAYMSPEQAGASADVDARSDQYSLACVLYTMLSGEPPFTGRTAWAVIARHLRERPPSLSIVRPNLSDSIEIAVDRALSKVPADRFETVEDFVAALSDASLLHPSAPRRWPWAAALVAAVAATLLAVLTRPPPLNASRVVGFPLEDRSVDPKGPTGADLAMVIGVGLEHAPVKWYDGWKWLPSDLRSAGLVAPDVASEIARSLEARYYLTGTVRVDADSVRVVVELMDVLGDSLAQRASEVAATGDADGTRLALRALVRLLPALLGTDGPRVDLSYLLDRDPSALAFWIRGDQHYRSSRFREALASYQQALDVDPQLALAALKGAQAASWIYAAPDARSLVGVALAHEELLPDQKRLYARGLQAYLVGDADQAVELLREAVGVDAAWPEAWMTLGEAMYHLVPSSWSGPGAPDSAFARVLELDPGFTPAAIHLAEAYTRENDAASVAALMDRLIDGQADPIVVRRVRWLLECLESGFPEWSTEGPELLQAAFDAGRSLGASGAHPECAAQAFEHILDDDDVGPDATWSALLALYGVRAAQGRTDDVEPLMDSLYQAGLTSVGHLYMLSDAFGDGLGVQASAFEGFVTDIYRERFGDDYHGMATMTTLWTLAVWYHAHGDSAEVGTIARAAEARAADSATPQDSIASAAIGGWGLLASGDTIGAIERFASLRPALPGSALAWDLWGSLASERIMLARLLLARVDPAEAYRIASQFDHPQPVMYLPHLPVSLAIRVEAADRLGMGFAARQARERLTRLGAEEVATLLSRAR